MAYATRTDLEALFGATNIEKWADLTNSRVESEITARVTASLIYATAMVDDTLRGGPYTFPLPAGAVTPTLIVDAVSRLAGVWLYESRGVDDVSDEGVAVHRLVHHKKTAMEMLRNIMASKLRLSLTQAIFTTAPQIVTDPT